VEGYLKSSLLSLYLSFPASLDDLHRVFSSHTLSPVSLSPYIDNIGMGSDITDWESTA
jgi:hypothetical protein